MSVEIDKHIRCAEMKIFVELFCRDTGLFVQRVCCSVLQCVAVCCSVLQCGAVCCSVLQYVAVCCSVLQCVAVCCSMLQWVIEIHYGLCVWRGIGQFWRRFWRYSLSSLAKIQVSASFAKI